MHAVGALMLVVGIIDLCQSGMLVCSIVYV